MELFAQASSYSYSTSTVSAGATVAIILFVFVVFIASYAIGAWLLGRIFKKAGEEPWKAWVPIYNNWTLLEIGKQQGFWAILALIPIVNIVALVFMIIAQYHVGLSLGKSGAFVLLAIFLPIVWIIWLAFDKSTWGGSNYATAQPPLQGAQPQPPFQAPAYQPPATPAAPIQPTAQPIIGTAAPTSPVSNSSGPAENNTQ